VIPAVIGAVGTLVFAQHAFWRGSPNLDEVAYQSQANAIAHGRLTLPAATFDPFFRPFLSGVRDGRVVFKYQPVWPGLLALSHGVFGSTLPLRLVLAAAAVVAVYLLALAVFGSRREALLAAYLVAFCPFLWVQAATLLGYQLSFVLAVSAAAAFVAATSGRKSYAIAAGVISGVAVFHRPFDAIVPTLPFFVYAAWQRRRDLGRFVGWVALGAAPFAVLTALYNIHVMGSPLRFPFGVSGAIDHFGFGWRASFEVPGSGHGGQINYTVGRAFITLWQSLVALPRFLVAAPVILVFALVAVLGRGRGARTSLLAISVLCVLFGYLYWWGTANAVHFGVHTTLGPFYHYFVVAPLVILAAHALVRLRQRWIIAVVVAAAVVWAIPASGLAFRNARRAGRTRANEIALLTPPGHAVVLETPLFPGDPYVRVANSADLSDRRIVAVDIPGREREVIERFPGRTPYLIEVYRHYGDPFGPQITSRVRANVVASRAPVFRMATKQHARPYLRVDDGAEQSGGSHWRVRALPPGEHTIAIGMHLAENWYECRFQAAQVNGEIHVLAPCEGFAHLTFPNGKAATQREDLSPLFRVDVAS
jgi:4-amino-4-deoxy-L-arabinose transferase-like glycosyltransferase